jgi:hypothetical protein
MLKKINGQLLEKVEDAHKATHVIASDGKTSIRRTPKLMIAMCRTPNIVSSDWLTQSSNLGKALPCNKFLILDDEKAEKLYKICLSRTIDRITSNLKHGAYLLGGWSIYVCKGVAGKKAPPEKELRLIVEAAGGTWLSSLSKSNAEGDKVLLVTSDPETKKQLSEKAVSIALKNGAIKRTTAWLFRATMTQELEI